MYDDIIQNIYYSLAIEGLHSTLITEIFNYCGHYSFEFTAFLGICIGAKFLKDSFR